MFFKYDRDRSGTLEKGEVHEAVRSLGICQFLLTTQLWVLQAVLMIL